MNKRIAEKIVFRWRYQDGNLRIKAIDELLKRGYLWKNIEHGRKFRPWRIK